MKRTRVLHLLVLLRGYPWYLKRLPVSGWLVLVAVLCLNACKPDKQSASSAALPAAGSPKVMDERLELKLFARDPDIVTPIGIAVDGQDRVFVLESHTHLPPKDYKGPKGDIIKVFTDQNRDGTPDKISVFAEGVQEGLNMAFSPEGHLYVVTSRAVWQLQDRNGDNVCDQREKVLELTEPRQVYAHAALLGITFSPDGWMYISRGNTGSAAWKLTGTDSSWVSGYGDGGNIVRARPDGTRLEEVATGFWNPVDVKFDSKGHLLAADNDPDSRGPNRLLHVVLGGDYGYESRYGGSGIHPYLAWNGELLGTLPYAAGLGEAPSGLLSASTAALPKDYQGQMLCSIWEESRIVRITLTPHGASVKGTTQVIVEGDEQFRPVAFAADSRGTIYFTDWVRREYPNHGKGRIWRLKTREGVETLQPQNVYTPPIPDPEGKLWQELYQAAGKTDFESLKTALQSADPYLQHAAIMACTNPAYRQQVVEATRDANPLVRLGAMLALQRVDFPQAQAIAGKMLSDPEVPIRQIALIWAGKAGLVNLRFRIDQALTAGTVTPALFETYLETVRHLRPEFIEAFQTQSAPYAKTINRDLPPKFIEAFIADHKRPAPLRALALRYLTQSTEPIPLLTTVLSREKDPQLRLEAVRSLSMIPDEKVGRHLLKVAVTPANPVALRAEALIALARQPLQAVDQTFPLLKDTEADIRMEAIRYLRTRMAAQGVRPALQQQYHSLSQEPDQGVKEQLQLALAPDKARHPASVEEWQIRLKAGGNPARGRRVFYALQSMCSACHAVEGRGGDLGPDLTNIGQSKTRSQIVASILRPSDEINPEYQGWYIRMKNGETHQGRQIDIGEKSIELYTQGEGFITLAKTDVADYGINEKSLMPDGLENHLTESELRDLIAFLSAAQDSSARPEMVRPRKVIAAEK